MKLFIKPITTVLFLSILSGNLFAVPYPFWKNVKFGFEYKSGGCLCGEYLEENSSNDLFPVPDFYSLNSFEGSVIILTSENYAYKIGIEYGWANLKNREGLPSIRINDGWGELLNLIEMSDEWDINKYSLNLEKVSKSLVSGGLELTYANAKVTENYYERGYYYNMILTRSVKVSRKCMGVGGFLRFSLSEKISEDFYIKPFCQLKLSVAREFYYDSPWEWNNNNKLSISFSGIYAGINISNGSL